MAMFEIHTVDEQIKALPTVGTASGSVASFDTDMTENLIDVECEIVYSQAEGTPSPDNPLLITTFSEMNVVRCGKNLLDFSNAVISGVNLWVYGDGTTYKYFKAGTYTFSYRGNVASVYYTLQGGSNKGLTFSISGTRLKSTFTLETSGYYRFFFQKSGGISFDDVQDPQIEIGNQDTSFVIYNGNTYNIPFGQTVAKGTLNVTTGVLAFDKGEITLDGTQSDSDFALSAMTGFTRINYLPYNNIGVINAVFASNILEYVSNISQIGEGKIWSNNTASRMFLGLPDTVTNKSQMQAWFSSNPTQVVFDYANEQVIQLSATQITALLNENNIWCDTGDTDVKFLLTVGKKIA